MRRAERAIAVPQEYDDLAGAVVAAITVAAFHQDRVEFAVAVDITEFDIAEESRTDGETVHITELAVAVAQHHAHRKTTASIGGRCHHIELAVAVHVADGQSLRLHE